MNINLYKTHVLLLISALLQNISEYSQNNVYSYDYMCFSR